MNFREFLNQGGKNIDSPENKDEPNTQEDNTDNSDDGQE